MLRRVRRGVRRLYERVLEREVDGVPTHIAVIQDGNRRYARGKGKGTAAGHRAGARTTENVLSWCSDLGIDELTLYAFSTENLERPPEERAELFDLIEEKLYEFADDEEIHDQEVRIRAIGQLDLLPQRVIEAVDYAEKRTAGYEGQYLNVALAYGGRAELLDAAREVCAEVEAGEQSPDDIDVETVENRVTQRPARAVDLIIRTGGDERTSNFLPWHANGNEAAVFFCAPYWPEFSRIDFLRAIRTYQSRQQSWRRTRIDRSLALLQAVGADRAVVSRLTEKVGEIPQTALDDIEDVEAEPFSAD
ncbi:polyprenyl diphosphate synthase [Halomarina oriensis]|uniref:Tritrans,polycis-undecaprenyl-diphosphate synthase (geranylgeranyl-diphosphate specific) n=1 Tax=Halomarina oriensis TaxID=671145 RepID=A0A6B0GPV8_9EURY|nr:polyprenyl diphosphate synthase [Halomarina oriensis]MWG34145.1 di-trans,poly-cis-decaprenylcistransferase [Halomarina oriensis]